MMTSSTVVMSKRLEGETFKGWAAVDIAIGGNGTAATLDKLTGPEANEFFRHDFSGNFMIPFFLFYN
jgi:hypothetical protein